jgi:hypothetical protein
MGEVLMRRHVIAPLAAAALLSVGACQPAAPKEYVYPAWGFRSRSRRRRR